MPRFILTALLLISSANLYATDTLFFRLSNPRTTVRDPNGKYIRKAVVTDSGVLGLDYNAKGILVVRGYYTDTNFNHKLYCHQYFDEFQGYHSEVICFENGKISGLSARFNAKGDTVWKNITTNHTAAASNATYSPVVEAPRATDTFAIVEKIATFPGGARRWIDFLSRNFRYPKEARKQKIEGTVMVQFVISEDGTVTDVRVMKPVHPLLDEEAVRIIQSSPKWEPAKTRNGKNVIYYARQPIIFRL